MKERSINHLELVCIIWLLTVALTSASLPRNTIPPDCSWKAAPGCKDIVGVALATNGVTVNNNSAGRKGEYFAWPLSVSNTNGALWQAVTVASGGSSSNGGFALAKYQTSPTYDLDGNLAFDGVWVYRWDAENRLIEMAMTNIVNVPDSERKKLEFGYDYQGRRVKKVVSTWNGSAFSNPSTNWFIYDGWNLVAIVDPPSSILQSFVWGQDLSGTLEGAGGIGGLLAVHATLNSQLSTFFPAYDGNGNVTALMNAGDGSIAAKYEYSPFGELIRSTGPMAKINPFRWSTKYWDEETGLVYYGYRYYSPALGRWMSRDPVGEKGGLNILAFAQNNTINAYDAYGLDDNEAQQTATIGGMSALAAETSVQAMGILKNVRQFASVNNNMAKLFTTMEEAAKITGADGAMIETYLVANRAWVAASGTVTTVLGRYMPYKEQLLGDMQTFFEGPGAQEWMALWQRTGHNILNMPNQFSQYAKIAGNLRWLSEAVARGDRIYLASPKGVEIGTKMYEVELLFLRALGYVREGDFMVLK